MVTFKELVTSNQKYLLIADRDDNTSENKTQQLVHDAIHRNYARNWPFFEITSLVVIGGFTRRKHKSSFFEIPYPYKGTKDIFFPDSWSTNYPWKCTMGHNYETQW
ncbi:hypothetical protein ACH5RR_012380 [Cinchona calisaya]|uniref:Uncharacterized protein n=1 Tax=Cinchona calisaya TaxID=153742 RepID=A0ABD3A7N4_9GENT